MDLNLLPLDARLTEQGRIDISKESFTHLLDCLLSSLHIAKEPVGSHPVIREMAQRRYREGMDIAHPL